MLIATSFQEVIFFGERHLFIWTSKVGLSLPFL